MGRKIGAVITGYIVIFIAVMISFTLVYFVLGTEGSFQEGSYEPSLIWNVLEVVLSFAAAVAGAYVCALIAKDKEATKFLAGLIIVLGIIFAIPEFTTEDTRSTVRAGNVHNYVAMQNVRQPEWYTILNPLLGIAGVMVGGNLYKKKSD